MSISSAHRAIQGTFPASQQAIVVEDDALERLRLSHVVARAGFEVREAADVPQALALLAELPVDVVVSDWQLPSLSGLDLCRALAGSPARPHLIMVTARDGEADLAQAIDAGADDFISKPYRSAELSARLHAGRRVVALRRKLIERGDAYEHALRHRERDQVSVEHELTVAARLQAELLEQFSRPLSGIHCERVFRPASRLGGDLFGLLPAGAGRIAFFHLDATGHGVAASLHAFSTVAMLQALVAREGAHLDPAAAVRELNLSAAAQSPEAATCTLVVGVVDTRSGLGKLCLAGHPHPLLSGPGRQVQSLGLGGLPLGALEEACYANTSFTMAPRDMLVLYSDGFIDTENSAGEAFGIERLRAVANLHAGRPASELARSAALALDAWRGNRTPDDDISMLAITLEGVTREIS
jgi:sigma-B regulation protein RsbU (phosphoserine phosphatase)